MNKLYLVMLLVLVGVALIGGFLVAGGPGYARLEQEDRDRSSHLMALGRHYACSLDEVGTPHTGCAGQAEMPQAPAPTQDSDYVLHRSGDTAFEVCSTFKTDRADGGEAYRSIIYFQGQHGCIRYSRAAVGKEWVVQ